MPERDNDEDLPTTIPTTTPAHALFERRPNLTPNPAPKPPFGMVVSDDDGRVGMLPPYEPVKIAPTMSKPNPPVGHPDHLLVADDLRSTASLRKALGLPAVDTEHAAIGLTESLDIRGPEQRRADAVAAAYDERVKAPAPKVTIPLAMTSIQTRRTIADAIRRNCTIATTQSTDRATDQIVRAVADWVEHPPEWVSVIEGEPVSDAENELRIAGRAGYPAPTPAPTELHATSTVWNFEQTRSIQISGDPKMVGAAAELLRHIIRSGNIL